jgi:magnesium chelatase accessory protein
LAPLLQPHADVLSLDLPGHAFTDPFADGSMTLPHMAAAVGGLIKTLGFEPTACIGHSAGAAILLRMAGDGAFAPTTPLISLNGALLPFDGFPGRLFSPLAKLLAGNPLVASLMSWRASSLPAVEGVLAGTGSKIDSTGLELYGRLFRSAGHVSAALGMMANWDLATLVDDMARLPQPIVLIAANNDRAVPADTAFQIQARAPRVIVEIVRGLGHLAHEEQPTTIAALILRLLAQGALVDQSFESRAIATGAA